MPRLVVCLPLCLLLSPTYPGSADTLGNRGGAGGRDVSDEAVALLEKSLAAHDRLVKSGYTLTMRKQERIDGTLHPVEFIDVSFRLKPYSVFFRWTQGARKASRALWVEGENDNKILAMPEGLGKFVGVQARDLDSPDAKQSGRYTIAEFGIRKATERILKNWKKAADARALVVHHHGVHKVPSAGDRPCIKLTRSKFARPEDDGIIELDLYLDSETLLQVGSVLYGEKDGEKYLIGEYFFRDIRLNPEHKKEQFTRAALTAP